MGKGIDGLVTPYNTSEFHAMVETVRGHHHAEYDQMLTIAAELRRMLGKVSGAPALVGVDSKIAARRVTRHLARAAGMNLRVAQATIRSYQMYTELFTGRATTGHQKTFDPNK